MVRACTILLSLAMLTETMLLPAMGNANTLRVVAPSARRVQVRRDGLVMALFLDRSSYPRNALVRATIRMWNGTNKTRRVSEPTVLVLGSKGRVVYSDAQNGFPFGVVTLPPPFISPDPFSVSPMIPARKILVWRVFVILRSSRLQATASILHGKTAPTMLTTHVLTTHLAAARAPRVAVRTAGDGELVATIVPAHPPQPRTLWSISEGRCGSGVTGSVTWTPVPFGYRQRNGSYRLPWQDVGCPDPSVWSLTVGWVNQAVTTVTYFRQP